MEVWVPLLWMFIALGADNTQSQSLLLDYSYDVPSEQVHETDGDGNFVRIRGIRDRSNKDFVLGGLFPVHFDSSDGGQCGAVRLEGGLERVEAMLYAIDRINADPHLLPNLTLGYDIRDTCYIETVGLDEALDLIIFGTQREIEACERLADSFRDNATSRQPVPPTLGLIGAAASRVSVPVANLARLYEMPQISYSSSSATLSSRDRFTFFYRTIFPDNIQVKALISLLIEFEWNHISIIYSSNQYGRKATEDLEILAGENDICIDRSLRIPDENPNYGTIAELLNGGDAEVVIVFASQRNALYLLGNYTKIGQHRNLTWIASDAWSQAKSVIGRFSSTLIGMFGVKPTSEHLESFHNYIDELTIASNLRNPWFPEYYSALTHCSVNTTCNTTASITSVYDYQQEHSIPRVTEAVYAFAHALQDYLDDNCDTPVVWNRANYSCTGQKRVLNGSILLEYLRNVSFIGLTQNVIEFNELGYVRNGSYEVLNYKTFRSTHGNYSYRLEKVGTWEDNSSSDMNSLGSVNIYNYNSLQFGLDETGNVLHQAQYSQCGRCNAGEVIKAALSSCCGVCESCQGQTFSNHTQDNNCSTCDEFTWGNNPIQGSNSCVKIEETFINLSHPWAIAMVILSLLGLIAVGIVAVILGLYWKTPVVKSSGREQMILLLIGIGLSYMLAFIYVSPPVLTVCVIQRIGLWFCFSLMFGALMVKITRIAIIFLQKSNLKPTRFHKPKYQIMFTCLVVSGQMLLVLVSVVVQYPDIVHDIRLNPRNSLDSPQTIVSCNRDHLAPLIISLVYETAIIAITTILGVISFRYPDNFNEAKHVSLCTFALAVIWVAFIPSYFVTATLQEFQNATISLAVIMSASAVLFCIFGPRLYVVIFNRERNTKQFSRINTTTRSASSTSLPTLDLQWPTTDSDPFGETPTASRSHESFYRRMDSNGEQTCIYTSYCIATNRLECTCIIQAICNLCLLQ